MPATKRSASSEAIASKPRLWPSKRSGTNAIEHLPLDQAWHVDSPPEAARLHWRLSDGRAPSVDDWQAPVHSGIGVLVTRPGRGAQALLLLFNPGETELDFALPQGRWQPLLCSAGPGSAPGTVPARALVLLQRQEP